MRKADHIPITACHSLPERPSPPASSWIENTTETKAPARPPQVKARRYKDEAPAGGQFDDIVADVSQHQRAVSDVGKADQRTGIDVGTQNPPGAGIDEHADRIARRRCHEHFYAAIRRPRRINAGDFSARIGGDRSHGHFAERNRFGHWRHDAKVTMEHIVNLVIEEIDRARHGENEHEGCNHETGIEMPAPDRAVQSQG